MVAKTDNKKEILISRILKDTADFVEDEVEYKNFLESLDPLVLEIFALAPTQEACYTGVKTLFPVLMKGGYLIDNR
ncbi:MAG: hypothetical protein KO464_07910 [Candidatus Methanofastidiosum sp.]|nr:hypothetical protein [Methanofastidiosum sp.]